jgi:hypothetical protein
MDTAVRKCSSQTETVTKSVLIIGVLICVFCDASVANPALETIQRLAKLVTDLKHSNRIQEQISSIMTENDNLKRRMSEMSEENIQMKQGVSDLWWEQLQINRDLTSKIDEMNNKFRTIIFQKGDNGEANYQEDGLKTLHRTEIKLTSTPSFGNVSHTTASSTSKRHQRIGPEPTGLRLQSRRLRRLLLPGNASFISLVVNHKG